MPTFVVDASVLAALYLDEQGSCGAAEALAQLDSEGADLHTPDLALAEVANALWKRVRRSELTGQVATEALDALARTRIAFHSTGALARQALGIALAHGVTVYDATYLALSATLGGTVLTGDGRLFAQARAAGLPVARAEDITAKG